MNCTAFSQPHDPTNVMSGVACPLLNLGAVLSILRQVVPLPRESRPCETAKMRPSDPIYMRGRPFASPFALAFPPFY